MCQFIKWAFNLWRVSVFYGKRKSDIEFMMDDICIGNPLYNRIDFLAFWQRQSGSEDSNSLKQTAATN